MHELLSPTRRYDTNLHDKLRLTGVIGNLIHHVNAGKTCLWHAAPGAIIYVHLQARRVACNRAEKYNDVHMPTL